MTYLSTFKEYLTTRTDAPPVFHLHAGLCSLAVAMGTNCWVDGPAREVYPNLNCVLLAPSGMGKSVPLDMATNIVRKAGLGERILPASFSHEALLEQLGREPVGLFVVQEFAAFQALLGRDYNQGAEQTLTELYDVPDTFQRKLRKSEGFTLKSPCVTILGASSPDWFAQTFKSTALRGGWLARFLFCPSREAGEPIGDPGPRDEATEVGLAEHLRQVCELRGRFDTGGCRQRYNEFAVRCRLEARESADFGGMRSRGPLMALKVAMLFHVSRDPSTTALSDKDMRDAIAFVERTREAAESYLTNEVAYDRKDAERLRLLEIVRGKGGCCPWSVALKNAHMDRDEFRRAVETLVDNGSLTVAAEGRTKYLRLVQFASSLRNGREFANRGLANFANSGETDVPF